MISFKLFPVSEAKARFYELLKLAAAHENIVIENKATGQRFKIVPVEDNTELKKIDVLARLGKTGLKGKSPSEIKKILQTRPS